MKQNRIRLLVVDDSIYMQMAIRAMISVHPEIEIVGEANDGEQAVAMARQLLPDVITMDVNMPGLDGLAATRRIMADAPAPIIMLSSLTEKGGRITFDALELGAVDYVSKSSSAIDVDLASVAAQVAAKIHFWGQRNQAADHRTAALPAIPAATDVLLIAAGSGSPATISQFLKECGPQPFPVVVAQDMPASFTAAYVDFLARTTGLPVSEGTHRMALENGSVTVVPGGRQGKLMRQPPSAALCLDLLPGQHNADTAVALLASATAAASPLCVILSGSAKLASPVVLQDIATGSVLWVQAPHTCVDEGLPRAMLATGLPTVLIEPAALHTGRTPAQESPP